jgi:hypothetical protein
MGWTEGWTKPEQDSPSSIFSTLARRVAEKTGKNYLDIAGQDAC